ncbi:uncharacterized protein V6R79_018661 [Siganus canaliculatus]
MMPGDSQATTVAIAADATVGSCQNCSVLHQSLNEYVSTLLALKQRIAVSDDSIRLQQQLEELQITMAALEKKTADYESVQAELEEKKTALKVIGHMSEEMDKLKEQKNKTVAEKSQLENELKDVKELTEKQSLENAQLKREKTTVENDLLKTQISLKESQSQAEQADKLKEENVKLTNVKDSLENKVQLLEDSVGKQNHQISQLTKEKILLERSIDDLQVRLLKLERERSKDYKSTSTQASVPEEPKVDKEKFRILLQSLWTCVEPNQQRTTNLLHSPERDAMIAQTPSPLRKTVRSVSHNPTKSPLQTKASHSQNHSLTKSAPPRLKVVNHQAGLQSTSSKQQKKRLSKELKTEVASTDLRSAEVSFEEIKAFFKPMLPCLSPLPDLETSVEPMETDVVVKENEPRSSAEAVPHQEDDTLVTAMSTSSHCLESPPVPSDGNGNLQIVPVQEVETSPIVNSSKDMELNELSGPTEAKDKNSTADEEIYLPKDKETELVPAAVHSVSASLSSSSSTLGMEISVKVPSLTSESQEPSCGVNLSGICENGSAVGKAEEVQLETITQPDVDTSPSNDAPADGGEPPRNGDAGVTPEEARDVQTATSPVASSAFVDSLNDVHDAKPETSSEDGKQHEDSCGVAQDSREDDVFESKKNKVCQDTEVPENNQCMSSSSDSVNGALNKDDEMIKADAPMKPLEEEHGTKMQVTGESDAKVSTSESNNDHIPPSPHKSPVLKMDDGKPCAQANVEIPSNNDVDMATTSNNIQSDNGPSSFESPESVNCEHLKENAHSACSRLSPSCLFPTVQLHNLEAQPSPDKLNAIAQPELSPTQKESPPKLEKDDVSEKAEENTDTTSCTTLLSQSAAAADEPNKCLETFTNILEKPMSCAVRQKEPNLTCPAAQPPECIGLMRTEMGPPLPRLLTPLSTPPKLCKSINPRQAIGKLSFPSPLDHSASPTTPIQSHLTPTGLQLSSSSLNSPLPPNGVPSSPLQFGSATPKHAVPVPGRLPLTALTSSPSSSSCPSQENSMRILDTMYPDLSAHARTLSILRGNVGLGIRSTESGTLQTTATSQMSGFKSINSTSTAFTKMEMRGEKRQRIDLPQPKSSKCLKLDNCAAPTVSHKQVPSCSSNSSEETTSPQTAKLMNETTPPSMGGGELPEQNLIVNALRKIELECFDLLPVIQSHLYVGNLPKKPVLRSEEKEVIAEICQRSSTEVDEMISTMLNKLKAEKTNLNRNYLQALCRVYTGICRHRKDWEKAHILAYSILTEDFPDAAKLILFMVTTWPNVLSHNSSLCQVIHAVTKQKAQENLLGCLSAFLGWEKNPPPDVDELISKTLSDVRSGSGLSCTKHSRHGDDLSTETWEHIFTLQVLCAHKKWKWTYENVLGKELWPLMNNWMAQPRDQQTPVSDVTVATVLRLIGRLSQLGIKERCISSVVTVASVINTFGIHGPSEGVPWMVQLAAIYCIYDLSPSNPREALDAVAAWRGETSQSVPPAVTSCINQLASICRQVKH